MTRLRRSVGLAAVFAAMVLLLTPSGAGSLFVLRAADPAPMAMPLSFSLPGTRPLVAANKWLGGPGVDVFSNGTSSYVCPYSEEKDCNSSVKIGGHDVPVGIKWQCVELAQRLWVTRGWWPGQFPVGDAAEIWTWANSAEMSTKLKTTENGKVTATSLVHGDLIVWNAVPAAELPFGHVAVVDQVKGSDVFVKEQNWGPDGKGGAQTGQAIYDLNNGWLSGHRLPSDAAHVYIAGVVHHPGSTTYTPPAPAAPKVDLVFAIDTTGSMNPYIDGVKAAASSIVKSVLAKNDARIAVVEYRDLYASCPQDGFAARIDLPFSTSKATILGKINALAIGNGCDTPESVYSGLMKAIGLEWRAGSKKAIILMGDAPPHDPEPVTGYTLASVVAAAEAVDPANIYAVDIHAGGSPQFGDLATLTHGAYTAVASPSEAVRAIVHDIAEIARAPVALTSGPYLTTIGVVVPFDGSRSYAPDGHIKKWEWDFNGDGKYDTSSTSPVAYHAYTTALKGVAILRVTDDATPPQRATVRVKVLVTAPAPAVPAPTLQPTPQPVATLSLSPPSSSSPQPAASAASPTALAQRPIAAGSPAARPPGNTVDFQGAPGAGLIVLFALAVTLIVFELTAIFERRRRGTPRS